MTALLIALSLIVQAKSAEVVEPLPPRDDPEIRQPLGRVYLEWNRAIQEADKASDRAPVKKQIAIFEKLKRTREVELRKRFYLADSDLKFVVGYGDAARLPKASEVAVPSKPPQREEVELIRGTIAAAQRQSKIEEQMYDADYKRAQLRRGILPPDGRPISSDEFHRRLTAAAVNADSIPEPPCSARTRLGTACARKVPDGGPCWWHRQHPPE